MTVESNTRKIARLVSEHANIGIAGIIEASGLTHAQVENALELLKARGAIKSVPMHYELTDKGAEELRHPSGFPHPGVPGTGRRSRRRAAQREVQIDANSVVGHATAKRHALDMAWRPACT